MQTIRSALKELRLLRPYGSAPSTEVAGQLHATYTLIRRRNGQLDDFIRRSFYRKRYTKATYLIVYHCQIKSYDVIHDSI